MTLARAANRAHDRGDTFTFDLLCELSGREQDEAIRNAPTDELETALAEVQSTNTTNPGRRSA